jgi:hypothetical protein
MMLPDEKYTKSIFRDYANKAVSASSATDEVLIAAGYTDPEEREKIRQGIMNA